MEVEKIFFFKQKTAYDLGVRLVGSEMCIRDSSILSFSGTGVLPAILVIITLWDTSGSVYSKSVSYTHLTLPTKRIV